MLNLIKFECLKILKQKFALISIFIFIICIIGISFISISNNYYHNSDGLIIRGVKAIKANKASQAISECKLTNEKLLEVLRRYQKIANNPSNYIENSHNKFKYDIYTNEINPYNSMLNLIRENYSPSGNIQGDYKSNILSSISDEMINNFYKVRHDKVRQLINRENLKQTQNKFVLDKDSKLKIPFTYDYTYGWNKIYNGPYTPIFLLMGLVICFIISPIFANEYETGAISLILSSKYGKNQTIVAKILSAFIITTAIFIFSMLVFMFINFGVYGVGGFNASIQMLSFYTFYKLTILQVFKYGLILNYIVILSVMSIIIFISSLFKKSFNVLIISSLWTFLPFFMRFHVRFLKYILDLLPYNALDTLYIFSMYNVYSFGKINILLPVLIFIFSILIIFITLFLTYRNFKKVQLI